MHLKKIPKIIGGVPVKSDQKWTMYNGDKMITIRPIDDDDMNLWEYRVKDGLLLHMIDENGNIIH